MQSPRIMHCMAQNKAEVLDENAQDSGESCHALFPPEKESDEPADVHYILVHRHENGNKVTCPYIFPADELPSLHALHNRFGGGRYELVARDAQRQRIVARRAYSLPGKSKPLHLIEELVEETEELPAPIEVKQIAANAPMTSNLPALLGALAPLVIAYLQGNQQTQIQQASQQAQMFQTLLVQSQNSSREFIQSMQAMYQAQTNQLAAVLTKDKSEGGSSSGESFMDGIEWMQEFMQSHQKALAEGSGGENGESMMETMKTVMGGLQMLQSMQGGTGTTPPTSPGTES